MPRSWTTWQICQHRLAMLAAAGLGLTPAVSATPFGNAARVDDAALDRMRGGFVLPNGMDINVGIQIDTRVDGQLVLRTVLTLGEQGQPNLSVFTNQPAAPAPPVISAPVIVTPATPVIATPPTPIITPPAAPVISAPVVATPAAPAITPPEAPAALLPVATPVSPVAGEQVAQSPPPLPTAVTTMLTAPAIDPRPPVSSLAEVPMTLPITPPVAVVAEPTPTLAYVVPVDTALAAPSAPGEIPSVVVAPAPAQEVTPPIPLPQIPLPSSDPAPLPAPTPAVPAEPAAPMLPLPQFVADNSSPTSPLEAPLVAGIAPPPNPEATAGAGVTAPAIDAPSIPTIMEQVQLALKVNGTAMTTSFGSVRVEQDDVGSVVILTTPSLQLEHLVGAATGVLIANTADNRVIETIATVNVQLSDAAVPIGNTLLQIEAIALDAAGRGMY